jgi:hypothetical protein
VRIDDERRPEAYTKTTESHVVSLSLSHADLKSENVQIQAYCKSEDRRTQYIKTLTIFLKAPSMAEEGLDIVKSPVDLANYIDPDGLAIFGEGMNDKQKAGFFVEMADQINDQLAGDDSMESHEELAHLTYQVVTMIPKAGFK